MVNSQSRIVAAAMTALGLTLAYAGPAGNPASGLSRAEVRQDLQRSRATQRVTPDGEIGDTAEVIAAREAFNARQLAAARGADGGPPQSPAKTQALDELVAQLIARDGDLDAVAVVNDD